MIDIVFFGAILLGSVITKLGFDLGNLLSTEGSQEVNRFVLLFPIPYGINNGSEKIKALVRNRNILIVTFYILIIAVIVWVNFNAVVN